MLIAWTTISTRPDAEKIAAGAIENRLAACAQIDGPILSFYRWENKIQRDEEFRVIFKLLPEQADSLADWIQTNHPYDTPQWIVMKAEKVSEKYLLWARNAAS